MSTITAAAPAAPARTTSRSVIAGRIVSGLAVAFLAFDALGKVFRQEAAVEGTLAMGYADGQVVPIGLAIAVITVLYAVPRTAFLGALLLTAHLGGAFASMVVSGEGWPAFPIVFALVAWAGLYLRSPGVRELLRTGR